MKYKIPFIKPSFPSAAEIAEDYTRIVESNWFTNFGPYEKEFSQKAANFIGEGSHVATVSNATLGLFIAIKNLFKPKGIKNKVLIPSFTFAAGPEMLILSGLKPVFIDIDKVDWQPDLGQAEMYINQNKDSIAGILLCNTFGVGNGSIEKWEALARKHGLPIIIDSAAGFGSLYDKTTKVGVRGDCEVFSLHATKPFAVGEGGLIVSRDTTFIETVRSFQNFGFNQDKKIGLIGINAKLQEINAAMGIRQLEDFENRLVNRRQSLTKIKNELMTIGCKFQVNDENSTVPFVSTLMPTQDFAEQVINVLVANGVEARKYYEPLHRQALIMEESEVASSLVNTEDIYARIVSLPLHDSMSDENIEYITNTVLQVYEKNQS